MPASQTLLSQIQDTLKNTPEQKRVVGPLVAYLVELGWDIKQIVFGKKEWRVPKSPSEASKRERRQSFGGFPVDIALFDSIKHCGDPKHLILFVECKQPEEKAGIEQLEIYMSNEPHVKLGIFANAVEKADAADFSYRAPSGAFLRKRKSINDLPRPGEKISVKTQRLLYADLSIPTEESLRKSIDHLLDRVVAADMRVTRREEQLDQLCDLLLLKLESDKEAKSSPQNPPFFRVFESEHKTAEVIRKRFESFVKLYPEVFTEQKEQELRLNDHTINLCVEELSRYRLLDLGVQTISLAFQILRAAALKQGEGQFFTPQQVIEAGIPLLEIKWDDIVIDPACGTGGFLVETLLDMERRHPGMGSELSRWAQTHVFGIDKDKVAVKLTKAIMQIAGDGSAHCVRGDAIRTHTWGRDFPHLRDGKFKNGRFSVVVTNPPFGANLKVSAQDARLSELDIAKSMGSHYEDFEIGLLFFNRAYELLRQGGRLGIILPETYFFSSNYQFVFDWMKSRFRPKVVANVPMEAFQGFCRAKTNFYVFEKI